MQSGLIELYIDPMNDLNPENSNRENQKQRQYLNEFHKKTTESALKEVERLSQREYSWEEMYEQTQRKTKGQPGRKIW